MKLAIATTFLDGMNGVARVILEIAKEFDAKIYTTTYDKDKTFPEFKNLDVELIGGGGGRLLSAINAGMKFYNLDLKNEFDLINAHQTPAEWVRNKNSPVIWYCHSPNREAFDLYEWRMKRRNIIDKVSFWFAIQGFKKLEQAMVPKIEYVFTNSKNSQTRIKKYLNRESEILYPGIDAKQFDCTDYKKIFVYPSRIAPEKNIEFAIEAFRNFNSSKKGYKLRIVGGLSEKKDHQNYYKKMIEISKGLDIEFKTNANEQEYRSAYEDALAVLYSPINEDFGLVPLEGMAAYKPVIAIDEGGPRETVADGKDGFLVGSPEKMSEKMLLLSEKPELAEEMGKTGRRKVEKEFTWKRFLNRFGEKSEELVNEAKETKKR